MIAALPARAQFYDLDGSYRCFTTPDSACAKNFKNVPTLPPPAVTLTKKAPVAPTLAEAIARVKKGTPTKDDIALIERDAAAKNPEAVEVLAWSELEGIGMKPDAVAAFHLYGEAAALGVPHARDNEIAIFETRLTSDERQQVLIEQNH